MDIRAYINSIKNSNPELYTALIGMLDRQDDLQNTIDTLNARLINPEVAYGHSHVPKQMRKRRIANQGILAATPTLVGFNQTLIDNNDFNRAAGVVTDFTHRTPGTYLMGACVEWDDAAAAGSYRTDLLLNGLIVDSDQSAVAAGVVTTLIHNCVTLVEVAKDAILQVQVTSTIAATLLTGAIYAPVVWSVLVNRARNPDLFTENFLPGDF